MDEVRYEEMHPRTAEVLEKLAFQWTPTKARLAELGAGAAAGAAALGILGSNTYEPKTPSRKLDQNGFLLQRDLTPEEKKERLNRAGKAALIGMGLGGGTSLGISKGMRALGDSVEKDRLKLVLEGGVPLGLPDRKRMLGRLVQEQETGLREDADMIELRNKPHPQERAIAAAKTLLENEEQRIINLARDAKTYRNAQPWGHLREVVDPSLPPGHPDWKKGIKDPKGTILGRLLVESGPGLDIGTQRTRLRQLYRDLMLKEQK